MSSLASKSLLAVALWSGATTALSSGGRLNIKSGSNLAGFVGAGSNAQQDVGDVTTAFSSPLGLLKSLAENGEAQKNGVHIFLDNSASMGSPLVDKAMSMMDPQRKAAVAGKAAEKVFGPNHPFTVKVKKGTPPDMNDLNNPRDAMKMMEFQDALKEAILEEEDKRHDIARKAFRAMPQSIKGIAGTHLIGSNSREISSVDRLNTAWTADEGGTKLWEYLLDVSRKHLTSSHDKNNRLTLVVVSDGQDNRSSPAEMQKDDGVNVFLESHWSHDRARFIDDDDMIKHRVRLVFFLIGAEFTGNAVTVAQEAAKKTGGTFVQVQNPQDVVDLGIADVDAKKALGDDASAEMTGKDDKEDNNLVLILALSIGGGVVLLVLLIVICCCCCKKGPEPATATVYQGYGTAQPQPGQYYQNQQPMQVQY